jgi:outer membrane protein OmpA-like peptidoglycan-associated protein
VKTVQSKWVMCAVVALCSTQIFAQTLVIEPGGDVDPQEVARVLNPKAFATRSIKAAASSISLRVPFAFNSAKLEETASRQLDPLAEGVKLANMRVVVAGHTDAVGSVAYNRKLSIRRAAAVRDYLVTTHGIPANMVKVAGFGKEKPLPNVDPTSAENRRVEFWSDEQ